MHHSGPKIQSRTDVPFSCLRNNRLAWLSAMCGETKPKLRWNKTTASENQFSPRRQPRHQQHVHAPRSLLASTNSTEHHQTNKQARLSPYYSSQPPRRKTASGSTTQKFLQAKTTQGRWRWDPRRQVQPTGTTPLSNLRKTLSHQKNHSIQNRNYQK